MGATSWTPKTMNGYCSLFVKRVVLNLNRRSLRCTAQLPRTRIITKLTMTTASAAAPISRRNYIVGMTVIAIFFFIFGFVTWLNGILIPFLRTACELTDFQAYFVTTAFYISYFVMSLPASAVLKKREGPDSQQDQTDHAGVVLRQPLCRPQSDYAQRY